jgi:hypothetical protein
LALPTNFLDFVQTLVTRGLEKFGLYYSLYRGECVDNEDPEALGRIRVKVPAVFGEEALESWAWPQAPFAGNGSGLFHPPDPGDAVWVQFEMGKPKFPVYSGGWWGRPGGRSEVPFTARKSKPTVKVWRTKAGQRIELDETPGKEAVMIFSPDGSYVRLDAVKKRIEVRSEGDTVEQAGADRKETTAKNRAAFVGGRDSETVYGDQNSQVHGNRFETTFGSRVDATRGEASEWVSLNKKSHVFGEVKEVALRGRQTIIGLGWNVSVAGPVTIAAAGVITLQSPLGISVVGPLNVAGAINATGDIAGANFP